MEALIYDETPLADIIQGDAIPCNPLQDAPSTPPQFAPRGIPRLREHLRVIRRTATKVTDLVDEQFLERFRYTIIASQLLSDDPKPRFRVFEEPSSPSNTFTLNGAFVTAASSFLVAWLLHWLRSRRLSDTIISWSEICTYTLLFIGLSAGLSLVARRQYLKFVRRSTAAALSHLVAESHNLDTVASAALGYLQEVEVVTRGYEISHPLPPISRLDDRHTIKQCRNLRLTIAKAFNSTISQLVHFHNAVQPHLNVEDLDSYHHIYEISLQDYTEAVNLANIVSSEAQESLRDLRFLFGLHVMARKLFLIDLLALRAKPTFSDIHQWRMVLQILRTLIEDNERCCNTLRQALDREEYPDSEKEGNFYNRDPNPHSELQNTTPEKQHQKAQIKRFEAVANGIRSLNAKARILREQVNELMTTDPAEQAITTTLTQHYEHLGSELRSLLVEWERGRNTMFQNVELDGGFSRSVSGLWAPMSPSPSLGGLTVVDGGPADALKLLVGDEDVRGAAENSGVDEEVFEAVAKPRKRMSVALSRGEKIAKLQEDRIKRATLQEQAETTTNMLRELQMVIKHRPQSRPNNRISSV